MDLLAFPTDGVDCGNSTQESQAFEGGQQLAPASSPPLPGFVEILLLYDPHGARRGSCAASEPRSRRCGRALRGPSEVG